MGHEAASASFLALVITMLVIPVSDLLWDLDITLLVQGEVEEYVPDQAASASMSRRHSTSADRLPPPQVPSGKSALARRHSVDFLSLENRAASITPELPPLVSTRLH